MTQPMMAGLVLSACFASAGRLSAAEQTLQAGRLAVQVPVMMNYLLSLPPGYEEHDSWPLLLFLHGAGERGDDLELLKVHGLPRLIAEGQPFPFVVVAPQCPADQWWQPIELTALLDDIERNYKIDKDRIYVTGLSMGGFGTWALAGYTPDRFAAIVPICGGGEAFHTRRMARLPTWVFHGEEDPAVPLVRSEMMVEALQKNGGNVRFTVYPGVGHDSWTETYNNPDLYGWLLRQNRQATSAADE